MTLTDQKCIYKGIESLLSSGNAYSHSLQCFTFPIFLLKLEDYSTHNYNFTRCFVWVCNLMCSTKGRSWAVGI